MHAAETDPLFAFSFSVTGRCITCLGLSSFVNNMHAAKLQKHRTECRLLDAATLHSVLLAAQ